MKIIFYIPFILIAGIGLRAYSQAPNQPVNPAPANQGGSGSINPNLCATVSDPNGGTLQVRYFGRVKPANGSQKFTIIILPDTQYYTEEPQGTHYGANAAMFKSQTAWIANNRQSMNIVYVGQLGDCVQNGDNPPGANDSIEWQRADTAISAIESQALTGLPDGIPYGLSVGNHDQSPGGGGNTAATNRYNQYFGISRFNGRNYYGGHHGSNNDNHYELFSASGVDFLAISMEYDTSPETDVLDWAANLVQTYSSRKVIVMTHFGINETGSPKPAFGAQGQAIYDRLKGFPNFMLFVCGHIHQTDGEARRLDIFNGNTVHTVLSDYQERTGGGNGLLRIMEFDPAQNKISVKTYSPYTNTYETDADSQFELSFNMLPLIGQVNSVASGTNPCFAWSNLSFDTNYEWDMELYDGQNVTIGPVWRFLTPSGAQLPVSLLNFSADAKNKKIKLSWATVNELNNDHFDIERSKDGAIFSRIGVLAGRGSVTDLQEYVFYDEQPLPGKIFYRLKQVDINGQSKYSNTIWIIPDEHRAFIAWPNPVTASGSINIYLKNEIKRPLRIVINDIAGREVYAETKNNAPNNFTIKPGLPAGIYTIQLIGKDLRMSQKIVIMD
jgi:hypothetical protein